MKISKLFPEAYGALCECMGVELRAAAGIDASALAAAGFQGGIAGALPMAGMADALPPMTALAAVVEAHQQAPFSSRIVCAPNEGAQVVINQFFHTRSEEA